MINNLFRRNLSWICDCCRFAVAAFPSRFGFSVLLLFELDKFDALWIRTGIYNQLVALDWSFNPRRSDSFNRITDLLVTRWVSFNLLLDLYTIVIVVMISVTCLFHGVNNHLIELKMADYFLLLSFLLFNSELNMELLGLLLLPSQRWCLFKKNLEKAAVDVAMNLNRSNFRDWLGSFDVWIDSWCG